MSRKEVAGEVGVVCGRCNQDLPLSAFTTDARYTHGVITTCKDCKQLQRYGLNVAQYWELHAAQGGRCLLCGDLGRPSRGPRPLDPDHCHISGRFRGLLCSPCNRGMGFFGDDPARLRQAADYLEAHSGL